MGLIFCQTAPIQTRFILYGMYPSDVDEMLSNLIDIMQINLLSLHFQVNNWRKDAFLLFADLKTQAELSKIVHKIKEPDGADRIMNGLAFYSCCKSLEGRRNYFLMILALIWMTSGCGITAEMLQMSKVGGHQGIIKMSGLLSKKRTQLRTNNAAWNASNSDHALKHLQEHNGYVPPRFGSSSYLTSDSKEKTAHQEDVESSGRPPGTLGDSIKPAYDMPIEDNAVSVVKRSIVAESRKGSFYTSKENNSTITYSSTSFPRIYFPNLR